MIRHPWVCGSNPSSSWSSQTSSGKHKGLGHKLAGGVINYPAAIAKHLPMVCHLYICVSHVNWWWCLSFPKEVLLNSTLSHSMSLELFIGWVSITVRPHKLPHNQKWCGLNYGCVTEFTKYMNCITDILAMHHAAAPTGWPRHLFSREQNWKS